MSTAMAALCEPGDWKPQTCVEMRGIKQNYQGKASRWPLLTETDSKDQTLP
jgi:hypothetical protein